MLLLNATFLTSDLNVERRYLLRLQKFKRSAFYYRPQRSWAKVMSLQVCVILFTGGCLPQCMLGYHTPRSRHPPRPDSPWEQTPPGADTPQGRHPPGYSHTHPKTRHTPGADTPQSRHPLEQTPPQDQTPPGSRPPWSRHPLGQTPPSRPPPEADTPLEQTPPRTDTPWGRNPPKTRHPLRSRHPRNRHPLSRHPPQSRPPRADTPPEQIPPPPEADSGIRSTSGRYASYWNAFLLKWKLLSIVVYSHYANRIKRNFAFLFTENDMTIFMWWKQYGLSLVTL